WHTRVSKNCSQSPQPMCGIDTQFKPNVRPGVQGFSLFACGRALRGRPCKIFLMELPHKEISKMHRFIRSWILVCCVLVAVTSTRAQEIENPAAYVRENYVKQEYQIAMRDGVKLFTIVYTPKDESQKYPILMLRTPYSIGPYGKNSYGDHLGPSQLFLRE